MVNAAQTKSHGKLLLILITVFGLIATVAIYYMARTHSHIQQVKIDGLYLQTPTEINDFKLKDTRGKTFTKQNLKGHWTLMFFGFTNCGMVCPTTMAALKKTVQILKSELPADQLPQVMMVSVDPDRDSIKRMKEYVNAFNPKFIGARAEKPEIEALEKQLHLISVKMQANGQGKNQYTINHSAEIMVFNPEGKLQAYLSFPHEANQMVMDYKTLIKKTTV